MRRRRVLVALLAAPWLAWAVARTLALDGFHPAVAAMAFTPLAAVTAIVPVAVALAAREWVVAALAAVALAALVAAVAPRALDGPQHANARTPGRPLVVMSINTKFGSADPRGVLRLVASHHVDVLSLQELTPAAVRRLDAAGARALLPSRVLDARAGASGLGLMARRRLARAGAGGGSHAELRASLDLPGGHALRVVAVHPFPPITAASERSWSEVLRRLPGPFEGGVPNVVAGDLNATLDHRELRRVLDRGYADAADATGDGLAPTFPAGPLWPVITIDHVLVARSIGVRRFTVAGVAGTDHRAVIAELVLPPG